MTALADLLGELSFFPYKDFPEARGAEYFCYRIYFISRNAGKYHTVEIFELFIFGIQSDVFQPFERFHRVTGNFV